MIFKEKSYYKKPYMYTALLDSGVSVDAYADGTGRGDDGNSYRLVSHLDEDEDVVIDGWEMTENSKNLLDTNRLI